MPHLSQHLHSFLTHPIVRTGGSRYFPEPFDRYTDELVESNVEQMLECVKSIRRLMKLFGVSAKLQPKVHLISSTEKPLEDFLDTIQCLTNCRVSFAQEVDSDGDFFVSDTLTKALSVRLFVPEEAKRALEVDAEKSVKKRERLLKDVEKLQKVMSSDRYANVTEQIHGNNLKKMETLKEKIGRIDYIRSFVK
ncbi:PREDICTED: uncharacterized protein LOC108565103 [Nicrophorus vespilloides]|uniref:Uncharacterized protein LOC108565103 n=1 Tax=Nicrophorus vespilloides TaxID=110193 RepID=A0ABM1MZ85_NICVS|nr:PREDICTED: uncharacterized protein LOC108565103 [Nicrophorus vespilloides]